MKQWHLKDVRVFVRYGWGEISTLGCWALWHNIAYFLAHIFGRFCFFLWLKTEKLWAKEKNWKKKGKAQQCSAHWFHCNVNQLSHRVWKAMHIDLKPINFNGLCYARVVCCCGDQSVRTAEHMTSSQSSNLLNISLDVHLNVCIHQPTCSLQIQIPFKWHANGTFLLSILL